MKKDIKWLKAEVKKQDIVMDKGHIYTSDLIYLIYQLDEPEVLSQEWINEHKVSRISNLRKMTMSDVIPVDELENLIVPKQEITFDQVHDKLREESILSEKSFDYYWNCINDNVEIDEPGNLIVPKQELPVIPEYVAEYLEFAKKDASLIQVMETASVIDGWIAMKKEYDWISANDETFARAWLDGYDVEEEPLYYALIKGHELVTNEGDLTCKYWKFDTSNGGMFLSNQFSRYGRFLNEMSKEDWNDLGINHSNADFVRVGMDK